GAGHEHTDAQVGLIVKLMLSLAIAAAVIHLALAGMFKLLVYWQMEKTAPQYPLAVGEAVRLPPGPRLERFPREEIFHFRQAEEAALTSYGWVDKAAGTVHIPIEDAMRLTLQRLASRPSATAPALVDTLPSDASAGRRMEKR